MMTECQTNRTEKFNFLRGMETCLASLECPILAQIRLRVNRRKRGWSRFPFSSGLPALRGVSVIGRSHRDILVEVPKPTHYQLHKNQSLLFYPKPVGK